MRIGFPKKIPPPIDQSCVGYWKLNETSSNIKDWSGNGNNGILYTRHENLAKYSQDFSNSSWGGYCGTKTNITQNTADVLAPDGTQTAVKFVLPATINCGLSTCWGVLQSISPPVTADTYTVSVWLRSSTSGLTVNIGFNDSQMTSKTLTTSWVRYSFTAVALAANRGIQFYSLTANAVYYAWGAQLEKQSNLSSYSVTTSVPINNGIVAYAGQFPLSAIGIFNNAMSFNGTTSYVQLPFYIGSAAILSTGTTWCAWIKTTNVPSVHNTILTQTSNGAGTYERYGGMGVTNAGKAYFVLYNGTVYVQPTSTTSVHDGQWHHIVSVFTLDDYAQIYVDGKIEGSIYTSSAGSGGSANFRIGAGDIIEINNKGFFNGLIDEVRIYNRALSPQEIKRHYMAGR